MAIETVGVVGAGTMGSGIAQAFAQSGFRVTLVDVSGPMLDRARRSIESSLDKFVAKGRLTSVDRDGAIGRLSVATTTDQLASADLVVEAIVEEAGAKCTLLASLDQIVRPEVILASNTSSISITVLGAATKRPDRVLGLHFMNPVPLMPLVELIRGQATSAESMRIASELCVTLGKTPVEAADFPGFIANRILLPMINEAIYAVMEHVGTVEAIDTVMTLGMNHPMGPLTLADFIGLDVCLAILNVLHEGLGDPKYRPCPLLRRMVAAGQLGRKSGQGFYTYQPQGKEDRRHDGDLANNRPHILTYRAIAQDVASLGAGEEIPSRHEPRVTERPEQLDAARGKCIDGQPVQEEMRSPGDANDRGHSYDRSRRRLRDKRTDQPRKNSRAHAVSERPMPADEEIEVRGGGEKRTGQRQAAAGSLVPRPGCRANLPGRGPWHEVAAPRDGDSSESVANWARHQGVYDGRSCDPRAREAKVPVFVNTSFTACSHHPCTFLRLTFARHVLRIGTFGAGA